MPTIDLVGLQVTFNYWNGSGYDTSDVTAALSDVDTTDAITIPNGFSNLRVASQPGNVGGYELWSPPPGQVITKVEYVVVARANGSATPGSPYGTIPEAETEPFLMFDTTEEGGWYAVDHIPVGVFAEVVGRFERPVGSYDLNRIAIRPVPDAGLSIDLAYLAKRVTYGSDVPADDPALRLYPRDDVLGFGGVARRYPPVKRTRNYGQIP